MAGFSVKVVGLTDPPPLEGRGEEIMRHLQPEIIELFVINAGMSSGQPSVALVITGDDGLYVIETSLLALQAGARAAVGMAETHFGWTMPP